MKTLLMFVALFITHFGFCQKSELKKLCNGLETSLNQEKPMHMHYDLIIEGKGEAGEKAAIAMDCYKKGDNHRMVVGEMQEVVKEKNTVLVINHLQKTVSIQNDTTEKYNFSILKELNAFIDSATHIQKISEKGFEKFILTYPLTYVYAKVEVSFSAKTGNLQMIYALFTPSDFQPYHSMQISYSEWNLNWKPDAGFPNMEKYIEKSGTTFRLQESWKAYRLFQPQNGNLN